MNRKAITAEMAVSRMSMKRMSFVRMLMGRGLRPARFERAATRLKGGCSTPELRAHLYGLAAFLTTDKLYKFRAQSQNGEGERDNSKTSKTRQKVKKIENRNLAIEEK